MVADTVLYCHTKKFNKTSKDIFFWYPKERGDLKSKHDEKNLLTNDELVVVRGLLGESRHFCTHEMNILVDLGC